MMFFKSDMYLNSSLILYAIAFSIALILIGCHNWLLSVDKPNPFKRSVTDLSTAEKMFFYAVLFIGTQPLMWVIAAPSQFSLDGVIAMVVAFILSFFIIFTLNGLLGTMRENKLSLKWLINQNFLLTAYLIISIALSFLNWVKEIETYVQKPFLFFVILYAVLIIFIGILLGIPKKNWEGRKWPDHWQFTAVIFIDPLIIGVLIAILVKLVVDMILLIQ